MNFKWILLLILSNIFSSAWFSRPFSASPFVVEIYWNTVFAPQLKAFKKPMSFGCDSFFLTSHEVANSTCTIEEISTSKGCLAKWMTFQYSRWNLSHNFGNIFFPLCRLCWETRTLLFGLRSQAVLKGGSGLHLCVIWAVFGGTLPGLGAVLCNTRNMSCLHFID